MGTGHAWKGGEKEENAQQRTLSHAPFQAQRRELLLHARSRVAQPSSRWSREQVHLEGREAEQKNALQTSLAKSESSQERKEEQPQRATEKNLQVPAHPYQTRIQIEN